MTMSPRLRKLALTAHITFSVGWLGAVAVFLAHAIIGLTSEQPLMVQAAYLAMGLSSWLVIVPFCFGSLVTGLVQSLGTHWGLFKHYWTVVKLLLTLAMTILLLQHTQPISEMAKIAADSILSAADHRPLRIKLVVTAGGALLVLLAITAISVYKPWGMTAYGLGRLSKGIPEPTGKTTRWYIIPGLIILALLVILIHLHNAGAGSHH